MSEYWVSKKKYFCKYCEIYIADDAPSRQQHENGLRHKGNTERFIRGLYKAGEKRKKDLEDEKREIARVELAAQAAYAQDISSGNAKASTNSLLTSRAPGPSTPPAKKPPEKPSNPYANYSTAASLGYHDPDAERLAAEAERKRTQGVAGEWQVVAPPPPPTDLEDEKLEEGSLKRSAEADEDERSFKLRKRTVGVGLGDIYDPGSIPIRIKKEEVPDEAVHEDPQPSIAPKWTKVEWKQAGQGGSTGQESTTQTPSTSSIETKADSTPVVIPKTEEVVKLEVDALTIHSGQDMQGTGAGLFKKRRVPAGGGRGRRQM